MKRNILIVFVALVLVGVVVYTNLASSELPKEEAPKPNYLSPSFVLSGLDGGTYEVGGARDKPLIINIWASWCGPCQLEAPDLQHLFEKYHDEVDLYAVNATAYDILDDAVKFVDRYGFTFPVLVDEDGSVVRRYQAYSFPTSFLVDRHGVVRHKIEGVVSLDTWNTEIKRLLKY